MQPPDPSAVDLDGFLPRPPSVAAACSACDIEARADMDKPGVRRTAAGPVARRVNPANRGLPERALAPGAWLFLAEIETVLAETAPGLRAALARLREVRP